jgi:RHS repeat-associated protein
VPTNRTLVRLSIFTSLLACVTLAPPVHAQLDVDPTLERGLKPYGTFEGGAIDSVSVTNGNLNLHIPLISYPQRGGKLHLGFYVEFGNNSYTYSSPTQPGCTQAPHTCAWGTFMNGPGMGIVSDLDFYLTTSGVLPPSNGPYATIKTSDGSQHEMGATASGGWMSVDATGWLCLISCATVIDRNGIRYSQISSAGEPQRIEDPNGNFITATPNSSGVLQSYTDTMGRTIPIPGGGSSTDFSGCTGTLATSAAILWNPPGYQGGTMNFKLCYATVYYGEQTCTLISGVQTCGVTLMHHSLIQSIVLPNDTTWTFQYDSANPNVQGSTATGNLLQVTLPTGGYIRYVWTPVYICQTPSNATPTTYTYAVASRITNSNDGSGEHTWTYTFPNVGSANNSPYSTSSVDPLGQKTVHTLTTQSDTCSFYETQNQSYDSSGNLLKTVTTAYSSNPDPLWTNTGGASHPASNVVPTSVTTNWPSGKVSQVQTDYDPGIALTSGRAIYGLPTAKREYDYGSGGPGSLLRTTTTTYQALSNSSYLANNLLTLPSSVVVTDGSGITDSSAAYTYDQFSLSSSGLTTQQQLDSTPPGGASPGNPTTVVRGGIATTTSHYFNSGTIYQSTDPNLNTTTYAYSSAFLGAYPTTVTNALNQSTSSNFDFNSGAVTSITDPNSPVTSFAYDQLFRTTQINYPDLGVTTYCYTDTGGATCSQAPAPYKVVVTRKITSAQTETSTAVLDGFGRLTQSQANSDPQGTVFTDTAYDALGRVSTVSNPYRSGTDITSSPGTTTYAYDALGRKVSVTYPGSPASLLATAYCGPSTLVTDPTGKWRRSRTNGLGQLVEVDEPNSPTASVASNGCPGTGEPIWVTAYGYDAVGDLTSVLQNGSHARSFSYDSLSRLSSSTNPESGTILYNYDPNGNVTTKWDARNLKTDYTFDALNRLTGKTFSDNTPPVAIFYDGQTPPAANPTSAFGSVTITGTERSKTTNPCAPAHKSCPVTIYDSGTASITVNGVPASVSYGQSSTDSSISIALATAINGNTSSPVTATSSNATVILTAKATGPTGDYPLSATTVANDPTDFGSGSFTELPFGFTLNGGCSVIGSVSITNGIGRRTGMCDAAGAEAWAYDPLGRTTTDQRNTGGYTKSTSYVYTYAGSVSKVTYPTARVVNYTYDQGGRVSTATDGSSGITYATGLQASPGATCLTNITCYTPQGSIYSVSIGQSSSFTGLNVVESFNARLQPNEIKASSTAGNAMDVIYNFADPVTGKNAGHVSGITNNLDSTRSQAFTYDQLNRITGAQTSSNFATSPSHCWGEMYGLDTYGNLQSISATTATGYTGCLEESGFSQSANVNNQISGLVYDPSGNTTSDGAFTYAWDAESQLKSAAGVTYIYDGDGRRMEKSGSKLYWYGAGDEILAETNSSGTTTAEYIFFGGKRMAMIPAGSTPIYYVEDLLGTSRVVTGNTGAVCYDGDFYPYGGERPYTNSCPQNYKFEGKERDTETGNDDFGARYYSNRFGRWLSADWSNVPAPVPYASLTNPQTLNLYAMVSDDPESFADLNGHYICGGTKAQCQAIADGLAQARAALKGDNLTKEQRAALNKVVSTFGKAGDDHDGVTISFGQTQSKKASAEAHSYKDENGLLRTDITFNSKTFGSLNTTEVGGELVHERSHGLDGIARGNMDPQNKNQEFRSELRAYDVESYVPKGLNVPYPGLWNPNWAPDSAEASRFTGVFSGAITSTSDWCGRSGAPGC